MWLGIWALAIALAIGMPAQEWRLFFTAGGILKGRLPALRKRFEAFIGPVVANFGKRLAAARTRLP
jgi:hypothetical protein